MDKWDKRFMDMAKLVASWSSCYQENRHVGCVIVKDKRIVTTGYNGAPSGVMSCKDKKECLRRKLNIPSGTHHEICYAVHAEQNAIVQAGRLNVSIKDAVMYVTHQPCSICAKLIINSGINKVVYADGYPDKFSLEMLAEAGVEVVKYQED